MLPSIEIVRLWTSHQHGTFSAVKLNKVWDIIGLEPYNYGNKPDESCIPEGQYLMRRVHSDLVERITHGLITETFEAVYVPDRSLIRIHPGNTDGDTLGCLLVGDKLDKLEMDRAVLNSGETFKRLMAVLDGYDEAILTIREAY